MRPFLLSIALTLSVFLTPSRAQPAPPASCQVQPADFEGWKAQQVSNRWVTLTIVPQLGGRLMQVSFGGHPYLFVNPQLKGKYFPPLSATEKPRWYNYGGDKIWPLPEGSEDAEHWPGPLADALDDGEYSFTVLSRDPVCTVRLEGPADPRTGLQYAREIRLGSDSPEIDFHAVMKNASDHPIRWSVQSVTQYDTSASGSPDTYNREFWGVTPANANSAYPDGFHVRVGPAVDPAYSRENGLFTLHYFYFQRELWVDSPAGWLTVLDNSTHYAMVERFAHSGAEYPGAATIIFYTNGPALEYNDKGMPFLTSSNPTENPYYMEAEVNSPMAALKPGETYAMDTKWFPTRLMGRLKSVDEAGISSTGLTVSREKDRILLAGSFGVFRAGRLVAYLLDNNGGKINSVPLQNASPVDLVDLHADIAAPAETVRISVHLVDEHGVDRGSLAEAAVSAEN